MVIDEELYNNISVTTFTDYEGWLDKENERVFITSEIVVSMLEDLLLHIHSLEEQKEEILQDLEDNYRPISKEEQYGISNKDFL